MRKIIINNKHLIVLSALGVLFLDQSIKYFALQKSIVEKNYNSLLGISVNPYFSAICLVIFCLVSVKYIRKHKDDRMLAAILLISVGIISNLLDRVIYGFIIDYIYIPDLFAFNIADIAIISGVIIFLLKIKSI